MRSYRLRRWPRERLSRRRLLFASRVPSNERPDPEVREGILHVGEDPIEDPHLRVGHVLHGEHDPLLSLRERRDGVVQLGAVEDHQGAGPVGQLALADLSRRVVPVQPGDQPAVLGALDQPQEDRVGVSPVVRVVVVEAHVVPGLRVEVERAGVRVGVGARPDAGAGEAAHEIDEGGGLVERQEERGLFRERVVADGPSLLVPRDVIPVDVGTELVHLREEVPLHHLRRQEALEEETLVLLPVLPARPLDIHATERAGQRLLDLLLLKDRRIGHVSSAPAAGRKSESVTSPAATQVSSRNRRTRVMLSPTPAPRPMAAKTAMFPPSSAPSPPGMRKAADLMAAAKASMTSAVVSETGIPMKWRIRYTSRLPTTHPPKWKRRDSVSRPRCSR